MTEKKESDQLEELNLEKVTILSQFAVHVFKFLSPAFKLMFFNYRF